MTTEMINTEMASPEERYQRLWQPPVPPQVLQFVVANAAIYYTAEKALRHVEEGESELGRLEHAVEELLAKPNPTFKERLVMQGISEFRATAGQMTPFCRQLMDYASRAQQFFGTKAVYTSQPSSVRIALQTPLGEEHVFMAPGANIPPDNGSWRSRSANVASLRYLLLAELDDTLSIGQAAVQHAEARLGAESPQSIAGLIQAINYLNK